MRAHEIRARALLEVFRYDSASLGSRQAISEYVRDLAGSVSDEYVRGYLEGLADQLINGSPARRADRSWVH